MAKSIWSLLNNLSEIEEEPKSQKPIIPQKKKIRIVEVPPKEEEEEDLIEEDYSEEPENEDEALQEENEPTIMDKIEEALSLIDDEDDLNDIYKYILKKINKNKNSGDLPDDELPEEAKETPSSDVLSEE
jgi:hypothetical protein